MYLKLLLWIAQGLCLIATSGVSLMHSNDNVHWEGDFLPVLSSHHLMLASCQVFIKDTPQLC